jgi:hypothetical protein
VEVFLPASTRGRINYKTEKGRRHNPSKEEEEEVYI